ncbi:MAG: hypothetical protein WCW44_01180 [archaeon]|jgi:hypothetical protein
MDKRETVLDSIKKLVSLGVSDSEIAENLYDVGIEKTEAYALIREARGPVVPIVQASQQKSQNPQVNVQSKSSSKNSQDIFEETVSNLSMNDQIVQQLPLDKQAQQSQSASSQVAQQKQSSDDIANRIMSDVASQDGEEIGEDEVELSDDEKDLAELEAKVSKKISDKQLNVKQSAPVNQTQTQTSQAQSQKVSIPAQPSAPAQNKSAPEVVLQKNVPAPQNVSQVSQAPTAIPKMDFTVASTQQKYSSSAEMSPDFEELWKKGIVVAVNAKLAEMKKIKSEVDAELETKVDEAVRKELYQFKVLLDSQKDLIVSSNKEALEQKQKEIVFIIDAKIAELKQYNKQIGDNLAVIESTKKQQELALGQITGALDDAKRTKAQLIVELNSEMIKSKSQAQSFLDTASMQLKQMDERVNKTLELEKNIADGMLQQAEQKIETLAIQRADELIANMEVELNRLQTISKKISPESLDQKISVLEEFRKQFLTNMQENLSQINNAIEQLNQKNALAERELAEKTLAIDAKLEELTKFEREFTNRMNKLLK